MLKHIIPLLLFVYLLSVLPACNKKETTGPAPVPNYTAKMGGIRNWHGTYEYHYYSHETYVSFDTSYSYPDTAFALKIVNETAVEFLGEIYSYSGTDSAGGIYFFGSDWHILEAGHGIGIMYYYNTNQIKYLYKIDGAGDHYMDTEIHRDTY